MTMTVTSREDSSRMTIITDRDEEDDDDCNDDGDSDDDHDGDDDKVTTMKMVMMVDDGGDDDDGAEGDADVTAAPQRTLKLRRRSGHTFEAPVHKLSESATRFGPVM